MSADRLAWPRCRGSATSRVLRVAPLVLAALLWCAGGRCSGHRAVPHRAPRPTASLWAPTVRCGSRGRAEDRPHRCDWGHHRVPLRPWPTTSRSAPMGISGSPPPAGIGRMTSAGAFTVFPVAGQTRGPRKDHFGARRKSLVHPARGRAHRSDHDLRRDHRVPSTDEFSAAEHYRRSRREPLVHEARRQNRPDHDRRAPSRSSRHRRPTSGPSQLPQVRMATSGSRRAIPDSDGSARPAPLPSFPFPDVLRSDGGQRRQPLGGRFGMLKRITTSGSTTELFNSDRNRGVVRDTGHGCRSGRVDLDRGPPNSQIIRFSLPPATTCVADSTTLCLNNGRFRVTAEWRTRDGANGPGRGVALTPDSGYFWFFDAANVEVVVKVLERVRVELPLLDRSPAGSPTSGSRPP